MTFLQLNELDLKELLNSLPKTKAHFEHVI
jgi:hypothetical protein